MGKQGELLNKFKERDKFFSVLASADLIFISRYVYINFQKFTQVKTYLARKNESICFVIFHSSLDNFL